MTSRKCLTIILLSFFLVNCGPLPALSVERIDDGDFEVFLLSGEELGLGRDSFLFGLSRRTFEEITANLEEKEIPEEDFAASRTAFEECLSRIVEEREGANEVEKRHRMESSIWKGVATILGIITTGLIIKVILK